MKVAYVPDVTARPSPRDLRGAALLGFRRAIKRFRLSARVAQLPPGQHACPTLMYLARQRYDLIVIGELRNERDYRDLVAVAKRFPRTKFVVADRAQKKSPPNIQGSIWRVEQPAYLAGLMEKRRAGKDVVGSVGGMSIPQVNPFIAGFEAGAKSVSPAITTLRSYSNDFLNARKCGSVALSQIAKVPEF